MVPSKPSRLSTSRRFGQLRKLLYRYRTKRYYLNEIAMAIDNGTQFTNAQRASTRKMLNGYGVSNGTLLGAQIYLSRLRDAEPAKWDDITPRFLCLLNFINPKMYCNYPYTYHFVYLSSCICSNPSHSFDYSIYRHFALLPLGETLDLQL